MTEEVDRRIWNRAKRLYDVMPGAREADTNYVGDWILCDDEDTLMKSTPEWVFCWAIASEIEAARGDEE